MLNRDTLLALGLGSLLMLGAISPAVAGPGPGGNHQARGASPDRPAVLKTHHRHGHRNFNHRYRKHDRRSYRRDRDHAHWRPHPRPRRHYNHYYFHNGEFAGGLLLGGVLGYVIGSDY